MISAEGTLSSADFFFKINFFLKILSGIASACQAVWIPIRPDALLGWVWFQTICKEYQIAEDTLSTADFFQNQLFKEINSGMASACQKVWIQIRPNKMLGLIWFQTVCKGYLLINFKMNFFQEILLGITAECQTVWIQIRPDIRSA